MGTPLSAAANCAKSAAVAALTDPMRLRNLEIKSDLPSGVTNWGPSHRKLSLIHCTVGYINMNSVHVGGSRCKQIGRLIFDYESGHRCSHIALRNSRTSWRAIVGTDSSLEQDRA